ncbi:hypothetical protein [Emcibacter sp. SYSU 3D8]|uniref:hypothetical protein n=1 Tax=Emcibacter sp. SYSU 3D8 TaxID=3133969 RepID=UPI0031FECE4B
MKLAGAGLALAVAIGAAMLWTPGNAQSPGSSGAALAFSGGWIPVGMNTTGDPALPSVAWFYNRDDGRVVVCRHGADDEKPATCSPATRLP